MASSAALEQREPLLVHRELLVLFVGLWALAALHLVFGMQHELHLAGGAAVGAAAMLPLLGCFALISGDAGALAVFGSLLAFLLLSWWAAAWRPASVACRWAARVSVAAYWLVTWGVAALSA